MVDTWQHDCIQLWPPPASGYAELGPYILHIGDGYMILCQKEEFQQKLNSSAKSFLIDWSVHRESKVP